MFNSYGAMVNPVRHPHVKVDLAKKFMDYLVSEQRRRLITDFKVNGEQLFYVNNESMSETCACTTLYFRTGTR